MITLAESKATMVEHIDQLVIDEFRRSSFLLDQLPFDNAVAPGTGGSTLTYGYTRLKTPALATFREINKDYTPQEAVRERASCDLKIFGGSFELDRVIVNTSGALNELDFQLKQKVEGARNLFHNTVINGDSAVDSKTFDGLDAMLTGTSTEVIEAIDLSTAALMDSNDQAFLDLVDMFISSLDGKATILMGNRQLIGKIKGVARRAGYYSRMEDAFGRTVDAYDGIPLVDLGGFWNGTQTVQNVAIEADGTTSLFAVIVGADGFHGVSPIGDKLISTALPDLTAPGVMKKGDVEMVAGVALKNSLKAGVLRGIKVKAGA